ncbi:hypothetical protein Tco_1576911 [Tanacetum coccineum]
MKGENKINVDEIEDLLNDDEVVKEMKEALRGGVFSVGILSMNFFTDVGGEILGFQEFHLYIALDTKHLHRERWETKMIWLCPNYFRNVYMKVLGEFPNVKLLVKLSEKYYIADRATVDEVKGI